MKALSVEQILVIMSETLNISDRVFWTKMAQAIHNALPEVPTETELIATMLNAWREKRPANATDIEVYAQSIVAKFGGKVNP